MNYGTDSSHLENHKFNNKGNDDDHDLMDIAMDIINPFTPPPNCPSSLPPETLIHDLPSPPPTKTRTLSTHNLNNTTGCHRGNVITCDRELDKELRYVAAAMQPVDIDPLNVPKPKRRNVRVSKDPQTVVARLRRERIAEKIRILKRLVPGGEKMDIASMLEEAARYAEFLERWIRHLQSLLPHPPPEFIASAKDPEAAHLCSFDFPGDGAGLETI